MELAVNYWNQVSSYIFYGRIYNRAKPLVNRSTEKDLDSQNAIMSKTP